MLLPKLIERMTSFSFKTSPDSPDWKLLSIVVSVWGPFLTPRNPKWQFTCALCCVLHSAFTIIFQHQINFNPTRNNTEWNNLSQYAGTAFKLDTVLTLRRMTQSDIWQPYCPLFKWLFRFLVKVHTEYIDSWGAEGHFIMLPNHFPLRTMFALQSLYGDYAPLVLNRTSLNSVKALLALSRRFY